MKICQLLHTMTTGGAEVLANRIGRAFRGKHEVVFACLDGIGELGECLQADGFHVENLGRQRGIDLQCVRRLGRFLRQQRVDVIHAHQYTPFFYATAARSWWKRLPVVFTEHGRFYPDSSSIKRSIYNRVMLRKGDHAIAVGEHVRQALIQFESFHPDRVEVIYNGIDHGPYSSDQEDLCSFRDAFRKQLGLNAHAVVVMQVARLDPIKDHFLAIHAVSKLLDKGNDIHLVIVGDGPERSRIESEIVKVGVQNKVHMLGLRRDVPTLLKCSDIALLTSLSEGIPLTLIEGMACGLPCVSTDVGGVREIVDPVQSALLCPARDVECVAGALKTLALNASLRTAMGHAGRRIARERFDEKKMLAEYDKVFSSLDFQS